MSICGIDLSIKCIIAACARALARWLRVARGALHRCCADSSDSPTIRIGAGKLIESQYDCAPAQQICTLRIQSESIIAHRRVATVSATVVAQASSSRHAGALANGSVSCAQFPCDFIFIGACVCVGREMKNHHVKLKFPFGVPQPMRIGFVSLRSGGHFGTRTSNGGGGCSSSSCCVRGKQCTRDTRYSISDSLSPAVDGVFAHRTRFRIAQSRPV